MMGYDHELQSEMVRQSFDERQHEVTPRRQKVEPTQKFLDQIRQVVREEIQREMRGREK